MMSNDHADPDYRPDSHVPAVNVRPYTSARPRRRDKSTDFILTGFHQAQGIRYYVYQSQRDDGSLGEFTVDADVRLLQKHGIALQELPLLCRHLLEKLDSDTSLRAVTFTEDLMKEQSDLRAALKQVAESRKKTYRRLRPAHLGGDSR